MGENMLKNNRILIVSMIFILFLSIGMASATDIAELSDNMISGDDSLVVNSDLGIVEDDFLSKDKANDLSIDYNDDEISSNASKTTKAIANGGRTIKKSKTKITAKKVNAYYKEKSHLNVYLKDSNNKALMNKKVKVNINHKTYSKTTDNFGRFALKLNLKPNRYDVKICFDGDDEYYASSINTEVNVKKAPLSIKTRNAKAYYDPNTFFKAKVINNVSKKPVEGVKVLFKVYSSKSKYKKYYSLTDENGIATLNKRLKVGQYDVYTFINDKKHFVSKSKIKKAILTVMDTREMGCSSIFLHVNENESALAFRRDSVYSANLYVVAKKWCGRYAIKQYKLTGTYFFHAITTSDGWLIGTGGWDNPIVNRRIEKLAGKIVSSNSIRNAYLKSILGQERRLAIGHFAIVAPDGRYAVVWRSGYIKGKLKNGQYLDVPNARSMFRHGKYKRFSNNTAKAALKIAATDHFGINRRNIMVYHYKRTTKEFKTNASVKVYGANDNGNLLGRYTGGIKDNVYYFKKFISKFKLPGTPKKKWIGTYRFGNIDKLFKTKTKVSANIMTSNFNQSNYFRLTLKNKKTKKAIKNVKVNLKIFTGKKYKNYIVKTDKNGIASFNTNVLNIGNHKVIIGPANNKYIIYGKYTISII